MPSKALLRPARRARRGPRVPGVPVGEDDELDPEAVLKRRTEAIHDEDDSGQLPWLEERGIDLFRGAGRIRRRRTRRGRRGRDDRLAGG